jgi:lipoate synthase
MLAGWLAGWLAAGLQGNLDHVRLLASSGLDVFAHNIETVDRLQKRVRCVVGRGLLLLLLTSTHTAIHPAVRAVLLT